LELVASRARKGIHKVVPLFSELAGGVDPRRHGGVVVSSIRNRDYQRPLLARCADSRRGKAFRNSIGGVMVPWLLMSGLVDPGTDPADAAGVAAQVDPANN